MSYEDLEISPDEGYVAELYFFQGTFRNYYLMSYATDLVYNGELYVATAGLKRKARRVSSSGGSRTSELEVTLPYDHPIASEYAFTDVPPSLKVTLYRGHISDLAGQFQVLWHGEVVTWTVKGREASLKVPSSFDRALKGNIPSRRWQGPCNHLLYDSHCGVSRAAHSHTTTLTEVPGTLWISVASLPWNNNEGHAGEIANAISGERRSIVEHTGLQVKIKMPFTRSKVGDTVVLYKGCNHSPEECKNTFDNLDRYGGFNLIPGHNPFSGTLR